jgi:phosphoribosyl 1,2-cyclic phosphate phosphodiesterase
VDSKIKITFLGTGTSSGVPMIGCNCQVCTSTNKQDTRLRTSIKIESPTTTIIIDCTPDFRYQMLRSKTNVIDAIVFTHPHKDHIAGIDDVRPYNFFGKKSINLYANEFTTKAIVHDFYYAFDENKYPGTPDLCLHKIEENSFTIGDITIIPIKVWHHKMPVLGFRIGNFTYITDANKIDEEELLKIKGSEVLVINALRYEKHLSHFTVNEAIDLINTLKIPKAFLTHLSHQIGTHNATNETIPSHIKLAFDGLQIEC